MKDDSGDYGKNLTALLKTIRKDYKDLETPGYDPIVQLIIGFLQWNSTSKAALEAYDRLMEEMVDHNDLRVSYPQQVVELIGKKYMQADERATRLRETLNEIFERERTVSLQSLSGMTKKQVKSYLESLPGIPPYVVSQVTLLCFGGHAVAVDDALHYLLGAEGVIDPEADIKEVTTWLERQIRAEDGVATHLALQAWVEDNWRRVAAALSHRTSKKSTSSRKTTSKKSPKKSEKAGKDGAKKSSKAATAGKKKSTRKKASK